MGIRKRYGDFTEKDGLIRGSRKFIASEIVNFYNDLEAAGESNYTQRMLKPLVDRLEVVPRNMSNRQNNTKHTAESDRKHVDFMNLVDENKDLMNGRMSFKIYDMGLSPESEDGITYHERQSLHLSEVVGFDADVDVVDSDYVYINERSKDLNLSIPDSGQEFYESNSTLYNTSNKSYANMSKNLLDIESGQRLVIESAPFTRSEKDMSIEGTQYEYDSDRLKLLQAMAEQNMSLREGSELTMGDFTYAHMEFVELERKDREMLRYMAGSLNLDKDKVAKPIEAMNLTPRSKPKPIVENENPNPKKHVFPTWESRMKEFEKESPVQKDKAVEAEDVLEL